MEEFKLIVAGSREVTDIALIRKEIDWMTDELLHDRAVSIVSGMARGPDRIAWDYAVEQGVQRYAFPAEWERYGKRAGYLRNAEMAKVADGLLAFHKDQSRGTQHMINTMLKLGKPVRVIEL